MRRASVVVLGACLAVGGEAQGRSPAQGNPPSPVPEVRLVRADDVVTITVGKPPGPRLSVDVAHALVKLGTPLTFTVTGLESKEWLEVDIVSNGQSVGPFPRQQVSHNPRRGRYEFRSNGSVTTANAETQGYWKYQVILRAQPSDEDLASLDPGIIVKNMGHAVPQTSATPSPSN